MSREALYGRRVPEEHKLKPGDEELPWRTYGQLWAELRLTRGALDMLVQDCKVPFVSGASLNAHLGHGAAVRLGATVAPPYPPNDMYYLVGELLAADAAARLGGKTVHKEGERVRLGQHPPIPLYADLTRCPKCDAEVQRQDLDLRGGCAVCNSLGDVHDAAERLGWGRGR